MVCLSYCCTFLHEGLTLSINVWQISSYYSFSGPLQINDTTTYASHLQAKLQAMQDFVHANLAKSAEQQKRQYDQHTASRSFNLGDPV